MSQKETRIGLVGYGRIGIGPVCQGRCRPRGGAACFPPPRGSPPWEAPEEKIVKRNGVRAQEGSLRPDDLPPAQKLRLVMEASMLWEDEPGESLRRKDLHEAPLQEWRKKATAAWIP